MKLELKRIEEPFVFEVENEDGLVCKMDASEAIGGKRKGMRPMELLAASLAGCAAIDITRMLSKKRIPTSHFSIEIEAKRSDSLPSPFEWIQLNIFVDKDIDRAQVKKVVDLTLEKYCSVSASLNKSISIRYSINDETV
ncbi:MAG: OsmC family protein [Crocinitomicaceae bacterium]|nr:OsmC family protein [Flavobacteriales bacterium]NQZ35414.1 OsmC family protein [Crocinitomicaceae bacterium]